MYRDDALNWIIRTRWRNVALLLSFMLATSYSVTAQRETYTGPVASEDLRPGNLFQTQDTVFFNPLLKPTIAETYSVDNVIQFEFDESSDILLPDSFSVKITFNFIYTDGDDLTDSLSAQELTIDYNKNRSYSNKSVLNFKDAYKAQIRILDITAQYVPLDDIRPYLRLLNDIYVMRRYQMDCTDDAIAEISADNSAVATDGELLVSWIPTRVAQHYDLEWAWVDKSALESGRYGAPLDPDPELIFKNNATRVTITETEYAVPLLYDGDGTLFFRVRGTQTLPGGEIAATVWSSEKNPSAGLAQYVFTGHERNLNWQATTSFAEEGKRKTVIQYFDGSLRSRQTVTKDNTTNNTVVAETLYDMQGRPAIQVLPAPTVSSLMDYYPQFNVNLRGGEFTKDIYDGLENPEDFCDAAVEGMGTQSGASRYYSPQNPEAGDGINKFIPDAQSYPFIQTQYTQDNTGRIYRQGGVGNDFQIGSQHETKYYYGTPEQNDLDALFGTEAGEASHYQKNMVRDANGQYSVAYLDMQGRTIATALAGDVPAGLQDVGSAGMTRTDNLLTPGNNLIDGTAIRSTKTMLVTMDGQQTFRYNMAAQELTLEDCLEQNICYDCLYDLNITITDNCNNQLTGGAPIVITKSNFHLFNLDTTCNTVTPLDTAFTVTLPEGEYQITKTLSISRSAMKYYYEHVFLPHNECISYEEILREQMDSIISRMDCEPDVEDDSAFTFNSYRNQMLADLTPPYGQYADTAAFILYNNEPYPRTGFSVLDRLFFGALPPFYQSAGLQYLDEEGNPDSVANIDGKLVIPQKLSTAEFIANFKESWAEALLSLHPEYCMLTQYEALQPGIIWDEDFLHTETFAEALQKGYLNPTNSTLQPAVRFGSQGSDPLFTLSGTGTQALQALNDSLFSRPINPASGYNSITYWSLATAAVKCRTSGDASCFANYHLAANAFNTDSLCEADLDMAWRVFRGMYYFAKQSWIDKYLQTQCQVSIQPPYRPVFAPVGEAAGMGDMPEFTSNPEVDQQNVEDNLGDYYTNTCTGYAQAWWEQLAPCEYTSADSAVIIPRLIGVCKAGSDIDHMLGSSTISPDKSYLYASFQEVITQYNNDVYGGAKDAAECNAYLITYPLPYAHSAPAADLPVMSKPEDCQCALIGEYYETYQQTGSEYTDFSDFIAHTTGVVISQGALDTLRNACNGDADCFFFKDPIVLPPFFQCNVGNTCATCTAVNAWSDSFHIAFPGLTPALEETAAGQQQVNALFAGFMNQQSGFGYTAQDYLTFMAQCEGYTEPDDCAPLNWAVYYPGSALDINADLYEAAYNNLLPVNQFFSDGYFTGPVMSQAGHYVLANKKDIVSVADSVVIMQWRVKPAGTGEMINPFVQTGNDTYVGAEWVEDASDPSWIIGSTVVHVVGGELKGMGLQTDGHGLITDWVKIISATTSQELYFDDFDHTGHCGLFVDVTRKLCGKTPMPSFALKEIQPEVCKDSTTFAVSLATQIYRAYKDSLNDIFYESYLAKCLEAVNLESFTVEHEVNEYHYTLYYYDRAGNLVKTVPPAAVHPDRTIVWPAEVALAKANGTRKVPAHDEEMATIYRYNSLNQVVSQHTPDAGLSSFWYDRLGRLAVSQNAEQAQAGGGATPEYSYTLYDETGRITEVGQKPQPNAMTSSLSRNPASLSAWLHYNNATFDYDATEVTATVYDLPSGYTKFTEGTGPLSFIQQPHTLRNRVSYTRYYDRLTNDRVTVNGQPVYVPQYQDYAAGTYYAYDIHGNVDTLVQDYQQGTISEVAYGFKLMAYRYDLISGKVNEVHYQPGAPDEFYHRYDYDAENRLTDVYTTTRKTYIGHTNLEEHEAHYQYYKHGPLARTIIGQNQVQGMDYAYTLQGWLKGVNSTAVGDGAHDMGSDGTLTARDAYGFSLNYFNGDYQPIGTVAPFAPVSIGNNLYNGNIKAMAVNIPTLGDARVYKYGYDQLNRLAAMDAYGGLNNSANTFSPVLLDDYKEQITYDPNGNILTYKRNGDAVRLTMDNLTYSYKPNTNQLDKVTDAAPDVASGDYDKYNDIKQGQQDGNYQYDAVGNLISDVSEGITNIEWTVYGKIKSITKTGGVNISYSYDAAGNRISKNVNGKETWYVRDASGNVMSVYSKEPTQHSGHLVQSEVHLYGSSRLGILNTDTDMEATPSEGNIITFSTGNKFFELTNHLGNVLATVSDRKLPHSTDGTHIDYYTADVVSANDYYPFGMIMPGRKYKNVILSGVEGYRYGFNGKEQDKEMTGTTTYDYGFRIYNPGLGRFLSVDPLAAEMPSWSPYSAFYNNPLRYTDPTGMAPDDWYYWMSSEGKLMKREVKNSTNNVYLMNYDERNPSNDKYVLINKFNPKSKGNNLLMIAFVGDLIKNTGGSSLTKEYGFSPNYPNNEALAYSRSTLGQIFLNTNRKMSSDYYDLLNSISHEVGHLKLKDNTLREHAGVYLYGFKDPSFGQSTDDHKIGTVRSFANYLYNIYDRENNSASIETISPLLDKFKELNTGISISYDFSGPTNRGGLNLYVNGSLVDYKTIDEKTHKE